VSPSDEGGEATAPRTRPRGDRRLTVALWLGLCAAVVPLVSVVVPGAWMLGVLLITGGLLAVGSVLRRLRVPAVGVTVAELAIWVGAVTAAFFADEALFAVIPTPAVFEAVPLAVQQASAEILLGVAPLPPTTAISFVIVAAMGALAIALDHVVITARMPLLASIALVAVWLIPAIAVPSDVNILAFAFLACAVLALIRAETRTREAPEPGSSSGVTAVAATIGAVAVVAALVTGPALPPPVLTAGGSGTLASIDPTLDLGDDLRQRNDVPVLTLRTDAPTLPYLRVATLSVFDGDVWQPDRLRSVSLTDDGMQPVAVDDGIRVTQYRTTVAVSNLASAYLPVPFPAVGVSGLDGLWRTVPYSRTVLSGQANAQGQDYEVVSQVPRPTVEQIRAADADVPEQAIDVLGLPESTPERVFELAEEVTAGATNDYDRLIALQSWFRGDEFSYSLRSPVLEGFDGSGSDAVAAFLEVREGYCVHFAGAFALMARALDMPSRIVVGFLPGEYTGDTEGGQRLAEVRTSQLHAWPEVHFEGIGWVAFEPTKSLGTATRFVPASEAGVDDGGEDIAGPTPTTTPTSTASAAPVDRRDDEPTDATGSAVRLVDLRPYLTTIGVVLVLALAPLLASTLRRRALARRARGGDVGAAWRMLQDAALDLGIPVPAAESPRAFGARLTRLHDAPAEQVSRLVTAVEQVSYGRDGATAPGEADLDGAAESARRIMLDAAPTAMRLRAQLLPRSLVVRPGSAFAGSVPAPAAAI
jgi:transglutaminase-like putative cysteine protease